MLYVMLKTCCNTYSAAMIKSCATPQAALVIFESSRLQHAPGKVLAGRDADAGPQERVSQDLNAYLPLAIMCELARRPKGCTPSWAKARAPTTTKTPRRLLPVPKTRCFLPTWRWMNTCVVLLTGTTNTRWALRFTSGRGMRTV